jgi:hypothetical protein
MQNPTRHARQPGAPNLPSPLSTLARIIRRCMRKRAPDTPSSASPVLEQRRSCPATRNQHGPTATADLNLEHLTIGQGRFRS